ncbi:MAG: 5-(carboxyamino)imidazole ribonucleotide synthase [Cardiobacteriaceae bacterium]|nr:5-(carboxyamino)imidazole ribonucleotide synthase [Cardiobacteriaceae bacterium]
MKIAMLGGGQLGRMFMQAAANYPAEIHILDPQEVPPCAGMGAAVVQGDFADYDTVMRFAADADVVGIEIEHVSVKALRDLAAAGKRVIPAPDVLALIQDKGLQKDFYAAKGLPTVPYYLAGGAKDIDVQRIPLPFVQKARTGGYDGKGVQVIHNEADLAKLWDVPSVIEAFFPIECEIAVFVVSDGAGDVRSYPVFEMVFDPALNLVDAVRSPAQIDEKIAEKAQIIARQLVAALGSAGLFAVEMFVTDTGDVWVNETAPRVHNSAHLTIEAHASSQFDQMFRVLAGLPLGDTAQYRHAAMFNVIGAPGHSGKPLLLGTEEVMAVPDVHVHWYGKTETRPGRKMGHVTVLAANGEELAEKMEQIQGKLKVVSHG